MKTPFLLLLAAIAVPLAAQSQSDFYARSCGPKTAEFTVTHVNEPTHTTPDSGKALIYIIQKNVGRGLTTRVGLDGTWAGMISGDSYIPLSVTPGEHHLCAASQDRQHPNAELIHLKAEPGKVYYYLVRGISDSDNGGFISMAFETVDKDEARYLLAADPESVAKPKP